MARSKEPFLSRWSRRKLGADVPRDPAPPAPRADAPSPELPPVDQLNFDSDYKGFLHPKVDEALRRQALKTLFRSAHFSQPDMLDDFNQDYTALEALAPDAAQQLAHAKRTLLGGEPEAQTRSQDAANEGGAPEAPVETAQAEPLPPENPGKPDGAAG